MSSPSKESQQPEPQSNKLTRRSLLKMVGWAAAGGSLALDTPSIRAAELAISPASPSLVEAAPANLPVSAPESLQSMVDQLYSLLSAERKHINDSMLNITDKLQLELTPVKVTPITDHTPVTAEERAEQLKSRKSLDSMPSVSDSREELPTQEAEFEEQLLPITQVKKGDDIGELRNGSGEYGTFFINNSNFPDSFRGEFKNSMGIQKIAKVPDEFMFKGKKITTALTYEGGIILIEGNLESGKALGHFLRLKDSGMVFNVCELLPNGDIFFGDNFVEGMFLYNHRDQSANRIQANFEAHYPGLRGLSWITQAEGGLYALLGDEVLLHIDLTAETPVIDGWLTPHKSLSDQPRDTIEAVIQADGGNRVVLLMKERHGADSQTWQVRAMEVTATGKILTFTYLVNNNPEESVVHPFGPLKPENLVGVAADHGESGSTVALHDFFGFGHFNLTTGKFEKLLHVAEIFGRQLEIEDLTVLEKMVFTAHSTGMNAYAIIYPDGLQVVAESKWDPNDTSDERKRQAANGYARTICVTPDGKILVGHGPLEGQFEDAMMTVAVPKQKPETTDTFIPQVNG